MSQALRKLTGAVNRSHTSVIFTNQIREKVGVMFGSPETTSGGRALKFYASLRLDIRRIGAIKDGSGGHREPDACEGCEEQVCTPVSAGRVRHSVQRGCEPQRAPRRPRRGARYRPEVGGRGSPMATCGWDRVRKIRSSSSSTIPTSPRRSTPNSEWPLDWSRRPWRRTIRRLRSRRT